MILRALVCVVAFSSWLGAAKANDIDFGAIREGAKAAWKEPAGSTLAPEEIDRQVDYVLGMAIFILYHEFGHGIVQDFQLPILGKPEDAVDTFAALYMIAGEDDESLDTLMEEAANNWFDEQAYFDSIGHSTEYSVHSVSAQRAANIICLLVGNDYEGWHDTATEAGMPEQRQKDCAYEYRRASETWDYFLNQHKLGEDEWPPHQVTVAWEKANPPFVDLAVMLYESGTGEAIAYQMENMFRLTGPMTVQFANCGEPMAWWFPKERMVKFCYEFLERLRQDYVRSLGSAKADEANVQPAVGPEEVPEDELPAEEEPEEETEESGA